MAGLIPLALGWKRAAGLAALLLAPVLAPAVSAADALPASSQIAASPEFKAWLQRLQAAARHTNFKGTFVVSSGAAVSSARIVHMCDGKRQWERIETQGGEPRQVFRELDRVHTVWPAKRLMVLEQREHQASFPALLGDAQELINQSYHWQPLGNDRVAGRDALVVWMQPRDGWRYGHRLWTDHETGLLLRADVLGERGQVLESSAFSELSLRLPLEPSAAQLSLKQVEGFELQQVRSQPVRLEAEGWVLKSKPTGFRLVSGVKRPLQELGVKPTGAAASVLQAVFSDGLTYVSVFVEPFDAARHQRPGAHAPQGATASHSLRLGSSWITAVGDVPAVTLQAFAQAWERLP